MDLMTLAAKITLDDSSFKSGIKSAEGMGEQLKNKMSAMTIAVGNLVTDVMRKGISGIQSVIGGAIDGYADYQQLIGGVETLFKSSSDKVANYAKQSFKTTGLSANEYMETVTGFSASLLQGLGGDTEKAADLANVAVQDMADNANKMGTDLSSIQTAYQGFAKQNYTMLDNLKLGYGGTKEEMVRLVNDSGILKDKIDNLDGITFDQLVEAIHKIQEEMGITGTTASEAAQTISGSKASLAAAWQDLLSAVGGEGDQTRLDETLENFKTAFSTYMENFIPTLTATIANSGTLVEGVAGAIASLPTDLIAKLADSGLEAGSEMLGGVKKLVTWLIKSMTTTMKTLTLDDSSVADFGKALGELAGTAVKDLVIDLPTLVDSFFDLGVTLAGSILEGVWDGLFGDETDNELQKIQDEFNNTVSEAELSSIRAQSILSYMSDLESKYGAAVTQTEEWQRAENDLETVLSGSKETFKEYGDNISGAISYLQQMTEELRKQAIMQAMQDKLAAQYKVLGEAEVARGEAEYSIEMAQREMNLMDVKRAQTLRAYGQVLDANSMWIVDPALRYQVDTAMSNPWDLREDEISSLIAAIEELYANTSEEEKVWNKSETDNILSPEVLESLNSEYQNHEVAIQDAENAIKEADSAIDKANQAINITVGVMSKLDAELAGLAGAASAAAGHLSSLSMVTPKSFSAGSVKSWNGTPLTTFTPKATGIDDVPYTGFRAELHKGEAILTKEENDARKRGGMSAGEMEAALENAVRAGMSGLYFNMNGNRVADLTTRRTGQNISANDRARVRAMGG